MRSPIDGSHSRRVLNAATGPVGLRRRNPHRAARRPTQIRARHGASVADEGHDLTDFSTLGLSPELLGAVTDAGLDTPTPIQERAIPLALQGRDVLGLAQTGTGKTLAFGLPLIDRLMAEPGRPAPKTTRALILAPTRELVNQIADNLRRLTDDLPLKVSTVVGGQSIVRQVKMLSRGTDILVATPGRLIDLTDRRAVDLSWAKHLVLDEADQMLDMGFIHALRKIAPLLGTPRQTMLFSATMPKEMEELSRAYLKTPERVQVTPPGKAADKIEQSVIFAEKAEKGDALRELLSRDPNALTLVFARTKHGAERLMKSLVADGFDAASIHGNKSQGQRDRALAAFRAGDVTTLVATDVAARGIDIPDVALVVNYELPNVPDAYVHRIGRTARAGRDGMAVALCSEEEAGMLLQIEKLLGIEIPTAGGTRPAGAIPSAPKQGRRGGPSRRRGKPGGGSGQRGQGREAADGGERRGAEARSDGNSDGHAGGQPGGQSERRKHHGGSRGKPHGKPKGETRGKPAHAGAPASDGGRTQGDSGRKHQDGARKDGPRKDGGARKQDGGNRKPTHANANRPDGGRPKRHRRRTTAA